MADVIPPSNNPATPRFARGMLTINFKFAASTGLLLFVLLLLVSFVISDQLRNDLTREVVARGGNVAAAVALKSGDPLATNDDIPLTLLAKGSVEEKQAQVEAPSILGRTFADLIASMKDRLQLHNEGIARVVIVHKDGKARADSAASSLTELGEFVAPEKVADSTGMAPYPLVSENGRLEYWISLPVYNQEVQQGTVHLFMRQNVVGDAVRQAITRLVAVMLFSLGLGIVFLWALTNFLLRPISALVAGVTAVAHGDFTKQIGLKQNDELGSLIDDYNGMAKSLLEKEAIQNALAKYTSKELVDQMLSDKAKLDLGGQRVFATIYFSVVRGVHALSSTMEPESYVALINEYLALETDIILKHGGSIDKFIGDEVMAIWGLNNEDPLDQATRATAACIEVQEAVTQLNKRREARGEAPFLVSIGLNCGDVVSGNMGSSVKMDFTVLGGSVNLAARLGLVAAKAGQTVVSQAIYDKIKDRFKFEVLPPVPLKGIKEPVALFWPQKALR